MPHNRPPPFKCESMSESCHIINPLGGGRNVACDRKGTSPKGDVGQFSTDAAPRRIASAFFGGNPRTLWAELPLGNATPELLGQSYL